MDSEDINNITGVFVLFINNLLCLFSHIYIATLKTSIQMDSG